MGTLQQAFENNNIQKDFLSGLFSSPIIRGFYKDERPVIDVSLKGGKYERRRMVSLINTIARNSPTGRKILEDASKAGYSFGFEYQSDCYGFCDNEKKVIRLNPCESDAKLIATLSHEARHAQQHFNSVPSKFCTFDVATELKLRRAAEADAQAAAAQTALEIRAATKDDSVWKAFELTSGKIADSIKKPSERKSLEAVVSDRDAMMREAFKGWYKNTRIVDAYERGYLYNHLAKVEHIQDEPSSLRAYFSEKPFEGHKTSAEIVSMVCVNGDGKSYFSEDPHILDREPEMCGISKETREMADLFFKIRKNVTGKSADMSYQNLPERGSLFGSLMTNLMLTPISVKSKPEDKIKLVQARMRQGR